MERDLKSEEGGGVERLTVYDLSEWFQVIAHMSK